MANLNDTDLFLVGRGSDSFKIEYQDLQNSLDSSVAVSDTAPLNPEEGDLWWADTDIEDGGGRLYIWTGDEWIDVSLIDTSETEWDDIVNRPDINDGLLTIEDDAGVTLGTFSANQDTNTLITLPSGGAGGGLDQGTADGLYLSKTNTDTANGNLTFNGNNTHTKGVTFAGPQAAVRPLRDDTITNGSNYAGFVCQKELGVTKTAAVVKGFSASNLTNGTEIYGFHSDIIKVPGETRFDFYAAGGADNYFSGAVGINTETPSEKLEVNGSVKANSFIGNATSASHAQTCEVRVEPGNGLTGGGKLDKDITLTVGAGDGLDSTSTQIKVDSSVVRTSNAQSINGNKTFYGNTKFNTTTSNPGNGNSSSGAHIEAASSGATLHISRTNNIAASFNRNNDGELLQFRKSGNKNGTINISGSKISITGSTRSAPGIVDISSDPRNFDSEAEITDASAVVEQIQPALLDGNRFGFDASHLETILPQVIINVNNIEEDGSEVEYKGVDKIALIPLLTKALKEIIIENRSLSDRISQLETDHVSIMNNNTGGGY